MKTEYFWQLLFILLGAFASGYAGYYFGNQPEENTVIEYNQYTQKNLKNILGGVEDISISYKNNVLEKISNTRFTILNTTEKNLDKFKIYFEVSDDKKLPLFHVVTPPDSFPKEAVTLISNNDGVYVFEIEYLNKTEKSWDGLDFVFYFAGSEPPKIEVKTGTKGMSIIEFKFSERDSFEIFIAVFKGMWWLFALYSIIAYLWLKMSRVRRNLHKTTFNKVLSDTINDDSGLTNDEKVEKIKEEIEKTPKIKMVVKNWNEDQEA